jgi:3-deoxy-manno-octulosonate cytidylyltransferase (CMP-KDO synthetase)
MSSQPTIENQPSTMSAIAVIPARFGSTRFPGKPLACETGKPLIQHVVERACAASRIAQVIVATDDELIADAVRAFGGDVCMTRSDHPNGTSRIAEVVESMPADRSQIIVNVQGDEPEIEPVLIDQLVDGLIADTEAPMATLASDFTNDEDPADPNIVKVVTDVNGRALYFSRALIPCARDGVRPTPPLKHPGLYAYRRNFLLNYATLRATPAEQAEQLEQLRALEHGFAIAVIKAQVLHHGIDTPEQYAAFVKRCAARR